MSDDPNKPESTPEQTELLEELSKRAEMLADGILQIPTSLSTTLGTLTVRGRKNRRNLWILGGIVLALIILVATTILMVVNTSRNTDRIQVITDRLNYSQTVQRQKVLCPLYTVFRASDTPQARAAAADKAAYDKAFQIINDGYTALDCKSLVQP